MIYRTKSDIARQHIQELIVSGRLRAGDRFAAREISEALGMSETPIREAIRSLAAEGWLELSAHLGAVVASIKREELAEVYALRAALEALALELGAPGFDAARLAAIDDNLVQSAEAAAAADPARYAHLNRNFHILLADTPATQWTLKLLNNVWAQSAAMHRGFEAVPARMQSSLTEHRAIRAALGAGDIPRAAALLAEHERVAGAALIAGLTSR
jgi:DNA-binding GntR family transcriptional regulator